MGEIIAFYTLATFILVFAIMVVTTRDTVNSVLFLVLDFLFVAALYVMLGAQFLAAIQVLVYAGGIVVLYLFVVMLVNLKLPPEEYRDPRRRSALGLGLSLAVLIELAAIAWYGYAGPAAAVVPSAALPVAGNRTQFHEDARRQREPELRPSPRILIGLRRALQVHQHHHE